MIQKELLRTWVEISRSAAKRNYDLFRKLVGPRVKLWAVVKSNAYGHGLAAFSTLMDEFGIDGFCVDSILEGLALRRQGILRPILVLGPTLPSQFGAAEKLKITISISTLEDLKALATMQTVPEFHIKIDTGMHRRGFYLEDVHKVIKFLKNKNNLKVKLTGIFTHFASAKDINYPTYTDLQFEKFKTAANLFKKEGFNLLEHAAATGGTLISKKYHLDAVRVGIGFYGLWPSRELEVQLGGEDGITLHPALSWRGIIMELKKMKKGDFVGYDLTERLERNTTAAILPVGYWYGLPRALSGVGEVLVGGKRARILGRVSMDLLVLDVTGILVKVGDIATLIGQDKGGHLSVARVADLAGNSNYEYATRLNPLMERRIIK